MHGTTRDMGISRKVTAQAGTIHEFNEQRSSKTRNFRLDEIVVTPNHHDKFRKNRWLGTKKIDTDFWGDSMVSTSNHPDNLHWIQRGAAADFCGPRTPLKRLAWWMRRFGAPGCLSAFRRLMSFLRLQ